MANSGRGWAKGQVAEPYYRESGVKECAKHVRLVAGRFVKDNATKAELLEACQMVIAELNQSST